MIKKMIIVVGLALSISAAWADSCSFELHGTDAREYRDLQGNLVKQIVIPSSCTEFKIGMKNVTKMHKNLMGHNVVIAKADDVKAIAKDGAIAGISKDYLKPNDSRVVAHSKMIGGGEVTSVTFPVSAIRSGDYVFFCSFLGHEVRMRGKLIVQ
ncbi:MAG: azurin [Neisseriaceae bacterium]|nr:azurin [Neisseriaceae bacterium]